jgi:aryl sulfotransferase
MIGVETSEELVTGIAEAASFGSMKDTARKKLDRFDDGPFVQASIFFDSATSNKWEGRLSGADLASYHARISELATPAEIAWLENGSRGAGAIPSS